ncbi:MAG: ABC transporter substrate-binding protein, partial [Actinobacteria bacterium]|nr:ABC transporter substrate-binding protein [Actinomycetota bacterium]
MRRRRYGLTAVALALGLVAAGCGSSKKATNEGASQASTTQPEQPVRGGTLVSALGADPGSLNPAVTSNGSVHSASEPMFNGLVGLDNGGKPVPELAASWTVEQNGAVYRFTLRDGVKWHDGQPFTSDDVVFTFNNALLKYHSRTSSSMNAAKVAVTNPDAKTVVFTFPAPYAPLLQQLNVTEAPIIPKHIFETCTDISTVPG